VLSEQTLAAHLVLVRLRSAFPSLLVVA